ncbi:S8 family serine peptidase, partial [Halomonas sp. AOP23-I1-17]
MANKSKSNGSESNPTGKSDSLATISCGAERLLVAALERGVNCLETGRFLISYREGRMEEGIKSLKAQKFRVADA